MKKLLKLLQIEIESASLYKKLSENYSNEKIAAIFQKLITGNELRAAVLGANDGLVSNMSLVMGVAGALHGHGILVAGVAGLLAGSISMALGEWLSVQCARELYLKQINVDEKTVLNKLMEEELKIEKDVPAGSAWKAAIASFFLFAIGAAIPVVPFIFWEGNTAIFSSLAFSTVALFIIGGAITVFTGKRFIYSGIRQVIFGLIAAAITYGIGKLIGVSVIP